MKLSPSVLALATTLMVQPDVSVAAEKAKTAQDSREKTRVVLPCAENYNVKSFDFDRSALPVTPGVESFEAMDLSFLKNLKSKEVTKGIYFMAKTAEADFEPMLAQIKSKFGNHPNWEKYETRVRKDFQEILKLKQGIESGKPLPEDDLMIGVLSATFGPHVFSEAILVRKGAATECLGLNYQPAAKKAEH